MKSEAIHDGIDKNLCYDWLLGDRKAVDEAFAKADKIIKVDLINNRLFLMQWNQEHVLLIIILHQKK